MSRSLLGHRAGAGRLRAPAAIAVLGAILQLGACATGREVVKAEGVVDDGKHNTVLVSYSVTYDSFDRDYGTRSADASLNCAGGGRGLGTSTCFEIELPFVGNEIDGSRSWNRFEEVAVQPYRVRYGQYRIDTVSIRLRVGSRPDVNCYEDKRGRTRCTTRQVDEYANTDVPLPVPIDFEVSAGSGCYLGHIRVHVQDRAIADYVFEPGSDEPTLQTAFDAVSPALRQRVRTFVDRSCS